MHQSAPPIQAPSPEGLAELLSVVTSGRLRDGPAFFFDPARLVFLMVIVEQGAIVHWQLEPCRDQAAADALQQRYMQAAVNVARMASALAQSGTGRDEEIARVIAAGGRADH